MAGTGIVTFHWKEHGQALQTGITDFFVHGLLTDTSIMYGSDISLQVHRLVMAVFLPSFKRSLVGDAPITTVLGNPLMALNFDCVADRGEDVRALIQFMYTGTLTVTVDRVKHLRQLAEDLCFQGLIDILSTDDHRSTFGHDQNVQVIIKSEVKDESPADDHHIVGSKTSTELPETIGVDICDVIKTEIPDDDQQQQQQTNLWNIGQPQPHHVHVNHANDHSLTLLVLPAECTEYNAHVKSTTSGTCNINHPAGGSSTMDKSTSNTIRCRFCDIELDNEMDLMIHLRCSHPTSTLRTIGLLKKEGDNQEDEDCAASVLRCKLCDIELDNQMDLKIHFRCSHPNTKLQSFRRKDEKLPVLGLLRCESCDIRFDSQMDLKIHFRCSHPKNKIYACKRCGFLTLCGEELYGHVLSHHSTLIEKSDTDSPSWCDSGGFDERAANAQHVQTDHNRKPSAAQKLAIVRLQPSFVCDRCPMMFKSAFTLKLHVRSKHGKPDEKLHKCTVCHKDYSISYLAQHMARVHNIKLNTTLGERIGLDVQHRKRPSISSPLTVSKDTGGAINETKMKTHHLRLKRKSTSPSPNTA